MGRNTKRLNECSLFFSENLRKIANYQNIKKKHGHLDLVVQTSDSAIHRINHSPADSVIDFRNTYPLDSDLSGGYPVVHGTNNVKR